MEPAEESLLKRAASKNDSNAPESLEVIASPMPHPAELLSPMPSTESGVDIDQETLKKLHAKRLLSDQQKQNELNLLKEAVRRAEE